MACLSKFDWIIPYVRNVIRKYDAFKNYDCIDGMSQKLSFQGWHISEKMIGNMIRHRNINCKDGAYHKQ